MFKNIKTIAGVKSLSKVAQKAISGGNFGGSGCEIVLIECSNDSNCPCNRKCGFITPAGATVNNFCELP